MNATTAAASPRNYYSSDNNCIPVDWPLLWARKFRKDLYACGKTGMGYTPVIKEYIGTLNRHPKNACPEAIIAFIENAPPTEQERYRQALTLFYSSTVPVKALHDAAAVKEKPYPEDTTDQEYPLLPVVKNISTETGNSFVEKLIVQLKLRKYSRNTINRYSKEVKRYLDYLQCLPSDNDRDKIEEYIIKMHDTDKLAPRTINQTTAALTFFYTEIIKTPRTIKTLPRMKAGKNLPNVYGQGDISRVLDAVHNIKHRLVLILGYGCGLRLSEIRLLRVKDIDWDRKVIRINGKGSKQRDIPIDECFGNLLKDYLAENKDLIFLFEGFTKGRPYSRRTIQKIYENATVKAKIKRKGGIHSLRHSYATHLLEQGVDINKIRILLGHSSVKTTQIYTHVSREEIAKIRSPLAHIKVKNNGCTHR